MLRDQVTGQVIAQAGGAAAETAAGGAVQSVALNSSIVNAVGAVVTFVGWVYLAYQLGKLAYALLTACDDSEFETAYSVGTDSCVKVKDKECTGENFFGCYERTNTYCCYNSMLGRIIHEEARRTGQLPGTWDNALANGCPGISIGDFSSFNFDADNGGISLEEWTNALISSGKIPNNSSVSMEKFTDIDNLTKNLSKLEDDFEQDPGKYKNSLERTQEVVDTSQGNYEDYRAADRELLIMTSGQYAEQFDACTGESRYVSDGTTAYYTRKPYVIFADGSKNYIDGCSRDPSSPAFSVQTEACGEPDSGMNVLFIMNEASVRVNLTDCR